MSDHLVYLATGREDVLLQARYAIVSALAWSEDALDVAVYTDRPDAFAGLGARVRPVMLDAGHQRAWRGRWDFFFRMKPAVIRDVLAGHPEDRALLVDADTFFVGPVAEAFARITPAQAVMHLREYDVGTHDTLQMRNFRTRLRRSRFNGAQVAEHFWMWNSGAVGLHASQLPLVDEWIAFIDDVYPTNPKPIVEQYGLSLLLQRDGRSIAPCDDVLFHYYDDKDRHVGEIRARLERLAAVEPAEARRLVREARRLVDGPAPRPTRRPLLARWTDSLRTRLRLRRLRRGR